MTIPIKPKPTAGMRHVALNVADVAASESFYVDLMGMKVEWRPDDNSVYLSSGNDNIALHKIAEQADNDTRQRVQLLDHIGFIIDDMDEVDTWYDYLRAHDVPMKTAPRTHRDGARSFYCLDPAGVSVQIIYHPPLSAIS